MALVISGLYSLVTGTLLGGYTCVSLQSIDLENSMMESQLGIVYISLCTSSIEEYSGSSNS